ncbi:hypothetical protein [Nitrobacter sp. TKz-YC02]|uniref:hypothetical protein n=1 Tax=Nitrobacter sp. TKz-YC02 TaxID=3398704 RepID=UPI003CF22FBE
MSQSAPKSSGPLTFDDLIPESGMDKAGRYAEDIGRSAVSGLDAGVAGLAGLPASITKGVAYAFDRGQSYLQGRPVEEIEAENDKNALISRDTLNYYSPEAIHQRSGLAYTPRTTAGEYAHTIGEFAPNALIPGGAIARVGQVLAPALASETAGQLTKGGAFEGPARFAGALAGGIGAAMASRPATAARALQEQLPRGVTPQMVDQAEALMGQARQQGIDLSWPEALSQVAQRPVLTDTMRHLEAAPQTSAQMGEFFGHRPQQVEQAARGQFDQIAPVNYAPESVGQNVSATARQFVEESPEAGILADNLFRAGPRATPEQAGVTIQNELRNVYDRREGMRAALADQDYTAARGAPATVPLNGGHRVADVTTHYLDRPNVPIILDQAERDAAKAQWLKDNNPTARMPILGERPTQFSQVDAASVVNHIDAALDTAKGSVRQVLQAAKSALMKPGGEIDGSVAGLHDSRVAITDLIDQAKRAGANGAVRELEGVLGTLDRALEQVPAYQAARKNFQAASRPLNVFEGNRAPGRIVERDQYNSNFVLPPDRATAAIEQGGPSAARDFNSVATPAAREAFEQNIVTQVLDKASREGADLSADGIRQALRQNEDLLRQYPGVRDKLESIAIAREGLAKVEQLPIGKLAKRDLTTKKAVDALFPANPLPNSQHEIASTVEELAKRSPSVANQLVRIHVESTFNNAAKDLQTGANQAAGAKFRVQLIGNSQQRANLQAAVEALPHGADRWQGFNRFLDILEATGTRQGIGSRTAYNEQFFKEAAKGGVAGDVVKTGANPLSMGQRFVDRYQQWKLGRNLSDLAGILTNPGSGNMLRAIARAPNQSAATAIALRLATSVNSARNER